MHRQFTPQDDSQSGARVGSSIYPQDDVQGRARVGNNIYPHPQDDVQVEQGSVTTFTPKENPAKRSNSRISSVKETSINNSITLF